MVRCSFDTISSHLQIIVHIFKLLDFEDQLRLSRVSVYLKCVFDTYIWRHNYQTLKIFEKTRDFVVSNDSDVYRLHLNTSVFHEFLRCYAAGVNKLTVRSAVLEDDEMLGLPEVAAGQLIVTHRLNIRQFPNLTSLQYCYMKVPTEHLKVIAQLYPNLQELRLINCFFDDEIQNLLENTILHMENLKTLFIYALDRFPIKYMQLHRVLQKLQLECLKLKAAVDPDDSNEDTNQSLLDHLHLQELYLASPCNRKSWSSYTYPLLLRNFEFLSVLTIEITDKITDEVLQILAQTCQYLEVFNIRFAEFENIQMFLLPPKVTDLSLYWCKGLTYNNLKQILAESKISKFYSQDTEYDGASQDIHISPQITKLHAPFLPDCTLIYAKNGNNLKELSWNDQPLCNSNDMTIAQLGYCTQLQVLETKYFHLPLDMILQLQYLHKLIMPHPVPSADWSYITGVLSHSSLDELIIRGYCRAGGYQELLSDVPSIAFAANIKKLQIPLDIFNVAIDFWLDLFKKNKDLIRICCTFNTYDKFVHLLRIIIQHKHFPRSVRSVNISGFILDCNDLRRNFKFHIKQLKYWTDFVNNSYGDNPHHIILQKKL